MATCSLSTNMYEEDANIHESKNAENAGQKIAQSLTCYWLKEKVQLVRLPFTKHAMSLTSYWSQEKMQ